MIWYKACPRCKSGAIVVDNDFYGWYVQCLQCAYMVDIDESEEVESVLVTRVETEEAVAEPA